jgi:hypothetical protein
MPEKRTLKRAGKDKQEGKAPSTQAGEFVREEMDHIRAGKHGAKNTKQAIAIGLSKARRAGVDLPAPAAQDSAKGQKSPNAKPNAKRSKATTKALKKLPHSAASHRALSTHAKQVAAKRKRTAAKKS